MNGNFILRYVIFVILFQFFLSGTNGQNQANKPIQSSKPVTAPLSKKLNVSVPGTLEKLLTASEKKTLTTLTLTGTIDLRDFEAAPSTRSYEPEPFKVTQCFSQHDSRHSKNIYKLDFRREKVARFDPVLLYIFKKLAYRSGGKSL